MKELTKLDPGGLLSMLHRIPEQEAADPFGRDILLLETHIAGTSHVPGLRSWSPI